MWRLNCPAWLDGDYVAEGVLSAGGASLKGRAKLTKPPTPWLPAKPDWRADRVLEPWKPLVRHGETIGYWNGEVQWNGPLPAQLTSRGQPLLAGPIRLVTGQPPLWDAPRMIEEKPYRVTFAGEGHLGDLAVSYETLMEFDGLIRADITLTPPAGGTELSNLIVEIPLRAEVATYYRNPACSPWDGKSLDEPAFLALWVVGERRPRSVVVHGIGRRTGGSARESRR